MIEKQIIKLMLDKNFYTEYKGQVSRNVFQGSFGSLYDLKPILDEYQNPVMVQSIDGVGTKTIIARKLNKFDTVGIDLLSACANDILVMGAKPLTFLLRQNHLAIILQAMFFLKIY